MPNPQASTCAARSTPWIDTSTPPSGAARVTALWPSSREASAVHAT
ncbi:hypothetical protein [Herbidospora sp. RD11066]